MIKTILSSFVISAIFYILWVGLRISDEGVYLVEYLTGDITFAICAGVTAVLMPKWFERREQLRAEEATL